MALTSPAFLVSNATSHSWVFSAIAELIDNAYDPDVKASQIHLNVEQINGYKCLTFTDDGNGLTDEKLYDMLSLGFSEKTEVGGHKPIGRYGNGFKSGSMRLGKDALVLTRQAETMSVGMLSRTYLEAIGADTVLIPIATFTTKTKKLLNFRDDKDADLDAILNYSIFRKGLPELLDHLSNVALDLKGAKRGTKIIIYNLSTHSEATGELELIFDEQAKDICLRNMDNESEYRRSLRKYCSILYLKPRMKIVLLGKRVTTRLIEKDLCKIEHDHYNPRWAAAGGGIKITFGFNPKTKGGGDYYRTDYGLMIYNKNRLIQAYEKVGYQKQPNELGVGVVGVLEVDDLTPIHNKQSFNMDHKYINLLSNLSTKLNQYWDAKMTVPTSTDGTSGTPIKADENTVPDSNWVQCDECKKWRRLPDGHPSPADDDEWFCKNNPDFRYNKCGIAEELLEEGEVDVPNNRSSYQKPKKKRSLSLRNSTDANEAASSLEAQLKKEKEKAQKLRIKRENGRVRRGKNLSVVKSNADALDRQFRAMMTDAKLDKMAQQELMNAYTPPNDVAENDDSSEPRVRCTACLRWRYVPVAFYRAADWTCSLHPNSEIQKQCVGASVNPLPNTNNNNNNELLSPPSKRVKTDVGDLTGANSTNIKSDDDDDDDELSNEDEALCKIGSDMLDYRMKIDALCNAIKKVKTETNTVAVQTDFVETIAKVHSAVQTNKIAVFDSVVQTESSPSARNSQVEVEYELKELRRLSMEVLRIALPNLPHTEPNGVVTLLRKVVEANRNSPR